MEQIDFERLVDALVAQPKESEWLEFKKNFHSKEEIGERISAIANSASLCHKSFGYLVFGVEDGTHRICGTTFYGKQKKVGNEELESWLFTRLNPRIDFEIIDEFDYGSNGHICIFKIPAAVNRPVAFQHIAYVRVGTTTRQLRDFPAKESKIWNNSQKALESIILKKGLTVAEVLKLLSGEAYFDMMNLPMPQDFKGVVERFESERLIVKDEIGYGITELGALLFAKKMSAFDSLRRKSVRVIVYKGKNKVETVQEQLFDVGYAIGFRELVAWVNGQLPQNEEIGQSFRRNVKMYPEIAIRELIANCIIHQDFAEQGFPMVEIYSDRIEISNPGQPLISVERFVDEYQSRNDSLADIMRRLGICEEKGSGMDKALFAVELYQLPPLRFLVQENRTTVTIYSYRTFADIGKTERLHACYQHSCLKYVSNEKMTNQSFRTRLGIEEKNYPMVSRIIKEAIKEGLVKEENPENASRRYMSYVPYWA